MFSFQVIDVAYALLIHLLLKTTPNFVVNWVYVGAVTWPEIGRYECQAWRTYSTVTRAR